MRGTDLQVANLFHRTVAMSLDNWAGMQFNYGDKIYVGSSWSNKYPAYATWDDALDVVKSGDTIYASPEDYDEAVVIPVTLHNLMVIGVGGRGSVCIVPSATNAIAVTNSGRDNTFINIGMQGNGTGGGFLNYGKRMRTYGCKLEGGAYALRLKPDEDNFDSEVSNDASDVLCFDTELYWSDVGVKFSRGTNGFAVTQPRFVDCIFHDLLTHITDSAEDSVRGLEVSGETRFLRDETGNLPTKFLTLNEVGVSGAILSAKYAVASAGLAALIDLAAGVINVNPQTAA